MVSSGETTITPLMPRHTVLNSGVSGPQGTPGVNGVNGDANFVSTTITADTTLISNKYVDLPYAPISGKIFIDMVGGVRQYENIDFTIVSGPRLSWNGMAMTTVLSIGQIMQVQYYKA